MRAIILELDSLGIGEAPDASAFGDQGADTFGHIVAYCANQGRALQLPHLHQLGLSAAYELSTGKSLVAPIGEGSLIGCYGAANEISLGKDTPSGHWEMAGLPVDFKWGYFEREFPDELITDFINQAQLPGVLGLKHASGTEILKTLGDEHMRSGKPIVYTSADSVFQIAAHEDAFGLERLYQICEIARRLVDKYQIGRVIARPFVGHDGAYERTANRRDYATPPHGQTLLDHAKAAGREVISIGKIADIFAHRGVTQEIKAPDNMALFDATLQAIKTAPEGALVLTNFVDFDSKYGHRRDVLGYAQALEAFDKKIPALLEILEFDDIVLMTADHGCDPTWRGSDHTRENVPMLWYKKNIGVGSVGVSSSFADMGQTVASYLKIAPLHYGEVLNITGVSQ